MKKILININLIYLLTAIEVSAIEEVNAYRDHVSRYGLADVSLYQQDMNPSYEYVGKRYIGGSEKMLRDIRYSERDLSLKEYFNDFDNEFINMTDLQSVSAKVSGDSQGSVYHGNDELLWFVKRGQYPWKEYLASKLMNLLLGTNVVPIVKIVAGENKLTASRMVQGLKQLKTLPENERVNLKGRASLDVAMDFMGLLDRHDHNMGYIDLGGEDKLAARVDFDHSFLWSEENMQAHPSDLSLFKKNIRKNIVSYEYLKEYLEEMNSIISVPDDMYRFVMYKGLLAIQSIDEGLDILKYKKIVEELIERKHALESFALNLGAMCDVLSETKSDINEQLIKSLEVALIEIGVARVDFYSSWLRKAFIEKNISDIRSLINLVSNNDLCILSIIEIMDEDHLDMFKLLIKLGVDINGKDAWGKTALIYASENNQVDMVRLLIDLGADIHAKDNNGKTALMYATESNQVDMIRLLIDLGADIYAKDRWGKTVLMYAAKSNQVDMVRLLIELGADINAKDKWGGTALICAVSHKHVDITKLLIELGADMSVRDQWGDTVLMHAVDNKYMDMIKLLKEAGAEKIMKN